MNLHRYLPNVVTFSLPLRPGDRIKEEDLLVLEVVALQSTLSAAGAPRPLFVAIHEKDRHGRMETLFVAEHDEPQPVWSFKDKPQPVWSIDEWERE